MGGLGNLMFQIAGIEYLGNKHKIKTGYWNIDKQISLIKNGGQAGNTPVNEYLDMFKNFKWPSITNPPGNRAYLNLPIHYENFEVVDNITYCGMFQSEKYFPHRDFIINLFKPSKKVLKELKKYKDILKGTTCAIHVRRGDYIGNNLTPNFPQSGSYYQNAINMMGEVDRYIIFSDDIEWCKKSFLMKNVTFIENEKDYVEIFLQSKCTHNIISNSTFSWWGAYLNQNITRKVIAPKKWFKDNLKHDLIPDYWFTI